MPCFEFERCLLEGNFFICDSRFDCFFSAELTREELVGKRVDEKFFYCPFQRTCAFLRFEVLQERCDDDRINRYGLMAFREAVSHVFELALDDAFRDGHAQRVEDDNLIKPVQKFGSKLIAESFHDVLAELLKALRVFVLFEGETDVRLIRELAEADV